MQIDTKELAVVKSQVTKAENAVSDLTIATSEDLKKATDLLSKIKSVGSLIKEKKEAITKPMNEALRNARDLFRPLEATYTEAERILKRKMIDYQSEVDAKAREQEKKIAARVEKGTMKFETGAKKIDSIEKVDKKVEGKTGQVQFRTRREMEVTDEAKIPKKYWVVDMVALRKDVLAGVEVPGTKVVEKKEIAAK